MPKNSARGMQGNNTNHIQRKFKEVFTMTIPTIQTIHHEEIIFGGLPGERKVIIDTALIDGKSA